MPSPVGLRDAAFVDPIQQVTVPFWLLYPAGPEAPVAEARFGPYALAVAREAQVVAPKPLPLVVISHGRGGTPFAYRDLGLGLARAGFAVGFLEHPGHSRNDNTLDGTFLNLENRPRHLRLALDAAFADAQVGPSLAPPPVAVVGHSMGGYTALAVSGGRPRSLPQDLPPGPPRDVPVMKDPRIGALVLLAPAAAWFMHEGALRDVDAPVLMFTGTEDELAAGFHRDVVQKGLPPNGRLVHREIAGAGHFSFMSPFPPAMVSPSFPPSQDPPGFDRAAFLPLLRGEIVSFLETQLRGNAS